MLPLIFFQEEPDYNLRRVDPARDQFEILLVKWCLDKQIPLLALCRGIQVLNIVCGGTVVQHLEKGLKHDQQAPYGYPSHKVKLTAKGKLQKIFASEVIRVNSVHHQALTGPAAGLQVEAVAADGVIEAVSKEDHPFALGVQWHPERMYVKYPQQLKLFEELVKNSCL